MFLTLDDAKKHLNIDEYFTEDDNYILSLIDVAEAIVQKHIDSRYEDIVGEEGQLPTPLLQAMLLMVGNLYQNREAISFTNVNEIPFAYDYLLSLYKDFK